MIQDIDIYTIIDIVKKSAKEILKIYNSDFDIEFKEDSSPLTKADLVANDIICSSLQKLYPTIPILSEENKQIEYDIRKDWQYYWCIDPIDGTKEFIKKNGEFTINIALIEHGIPVLGVVYAPVIDELYYAKKGFGAFKNNIKMPFEKNKKEYIIVASRSHNNKDTQEFIDNIKVSKPKNIISKGSSLKICLVASSEADIYPRFAPTMEWDTAAAHAIVLECGKNIYKTDRKIQLEYNKENLLNPNFIVY